MKREYIMDIEYRIFSLMIIQQKTNFKLNK